MSAGMTLMAVGCSDDSSTSGSAGSGDATELTWFFWVGSPQETKAWKYLAEQVSKDHPDITVKFTSDSWTGFWQKLPQMASTNSMADMAGLQFGYVGSVGDLFMPLNKYVKDADYDLSGFNTTMIKELSSDGNLLALPYDFGPEIIVYNKKIFTDKGVPLPKAGWTWDEFLETAQALTGDGTYGWMPGIDLSFGYDLTGAVNNWVKDGKFNVTNDDFVAGADKQAQLSYKYKVAPPYSTSPNWDPFMEGTVAMEPNGPWSLINMKDTAPFPFGWIEFPQGPDGMRTYNQGSGFGITKDCKNPEAAFKAITSLVSEEAENYLGSHGRAFPARTAAIDSWAKVAGEEATEVMKRAIKGGKPMQVTSNWTQFQTAMTQFEPLLFAGKISADDFAEKVQAKAGEGKAIASGDLSDLLSGS